MQDLSFPVKDASIILESLKSQIEFVPFCDYLKRYIYLKSGMIGSFREIPLRKYEQTVIAAFRKTGTPCSFSESKTPLQTRVANWLRQSTARRRTVLLLGFGLSMTAEDVNQFLTNAVHDRMLDREDPLDAVCLYCYERGYRFSKMKQLWQLYLSGDPEKASFPALLALQPSGRDSSRRTAEEDSRLLTGLMESDRPDGKTRTQLQALGIFRNLYDRAALLAEARWPDSALAGDPSGRAAAIERILYASVPRDRHGNLVPENFSVLAKRLTGKRLTRQHIHELLQEKVQPDRYDLITLKFPTFSEKTDQYPEAGARFQVFTEETNQLLQSCGYGPLYTADPYECFILMCILSVDPMGTYADVMELAYSDAEEKP